MIVKQTTLYNCYNNCTDSWIVDIRINTWTADDATVAHDLVASESR